MAKFLNLTNARGQKILVKAESISMVIPVYTLAANPAGVRTHIFIEGGTEDHGLSVVESFDEIKEALTE